MSQPLQFHGQYKDSVLGLYDMRQRDYNPVTGMFLATDPVPVPVGDPFISRYSYGFNNPLVFNDASGLEPRPWKDGRIVGIPGVGGVSAAVAKAAAQVAGTSSSGAKADGSAAGSRPSALPSIVGNCKTEAECLNVSCQRGAAYANTPHTDNIWTEAELSAARDNRRGSQQVGGGAPFGWLGTLASAFDVTWNSAWAHQPGVQQAGARSIPVAGGLLASTQSAQEAATNPLYSDLTPDARTALITVRSVFVGEATFLGGVGGAAGGAYLTKHPLGVFAGDVAGSNLAYAGSSAFFDSVMGQFKQFGEEWLEFAWSGDMPYLGRSDAPNIPGIPVPFSDL